MKTADFGGWEGCAYALGCTQEQSKQAFRTFSKPHTNPLIQGGCFTATRGLNTTSSQTLTEQKTTVTQRQLHGSLP